MQICVELIADDVGGDDDGQGTRWPRVAWDVDVEGRKGLGVGLAGSNDKTPGTISRRRQVAWGRRLH
jgi:hypothetical protein